MAHESEILVAFYKRLLDCLGVKIVNMHFFGDVMEKGAVFRKSEGILHRKKLAEMEGKMSFFRKSELKAKQVLEGITLKSVSGDKTMMTFFEFEPNSVIPSHKHLHEQITYIFEGEMEFTLKGETKVVKAGEGVVIPPNYDHSAKILSMPTKAVDAWYPIREDYK